MLMWTHLGSLRMKSPLIILMLMIQQEYEERSMPQVFGIPGSVRLILLNIGCGLVMLANGYMRRSIRSAKAEITAGEQWKEHTGIKILLLIRHRLFLRSLNMVIIRALLSLQAMSITVNY